MDRTAAGARSATCAILTCSPNELIAQIHNRMPVILPAPARDRWLDPSAGEVELRSLLVPLAPEEMDAYEVSTLVKLTKERYGLVRETSSWLIAWPLSREHAVAVSSGPVLARRSRAGGVLPLLP